MYGVGYSSVSRSVLIAKDLVSMQIYKAEKMGSRPQNQLLVGKNITGSEIMTAVQAADTLMTELGTEYYSKVVAIGGQEVEIDVISLNKFDPFDEETQVTLGMYALAFAWGLEPADVFPVGTTSRASEMVSVQRARGKLPETYRSSVVRQLEYKLLPPNLKLVMEFSDDAADRERAITEDIEARTSERNLKSGAMTVPAERSRMRRHGTITRGELKRMNLQDGLLEDGRPIAILFYNDEYNEYLTVDRGYLVVEDYADNPRDVIRAIQQNKNDVYKLMAQGGDAIRLGEDALGALEWLERQYKDVGEPEPEPEAEPQPDTEVNLEDGGVNIEDKL